MSFFRPVSASTVPSVGSVPISKFRPSSYNVFALTVLPMVQFQCICFDRSIQWFSSNASAPTVRSNGSVSMSLLLDFRPFRPMVQFQCLCSTVPSNGSVPMSLLLDFRPFRPMSLCSTVPSNGSVPMSLFRRSRPMVQFQCIGFDRFTQCGSLVMALITMSIVKIAIINLQCITFIAFSCAVTIAFF
jgi:hypothetical protein